MTFWRKKYLLAANATREIPQARRNELLAELAEWVANGSVSDARELFWVLEAGASLHMELYLKLFQSEQGAEILKKEAV